MSINYYKEESPENPKREKGSSYKKDSYYLSHQFYIFIISKVFHSLLTLPCLGLETEGHISSKMNNIGGCLTTL